MSNESQQQKRSKKRNARVRAFLGILVSIVCIWWAFHSVEAGQVFAKLRNADPFFLFLAVITTILSYVFRSWRWPFFFESRAPKLVDSFRCLIIGFFMNNVLPLRMGELVRAHLGGRATKQSRTVVLATIFGERLADGLMISALFGLLFTFWGPVPRPKDAIWLYLVSYLFLFLALFTLLLLCKRHLIFSWLERLGKIMPGHVSSYTLVRIRRFIQGLEPLLRPSKLFVLGVSSLVVWSIELLVYYQVTRAFDYPMTLGELSLFLAAVNFASLIPAAPGAIGVIEAFAKIALVQIGVEPETALAMVVAQHVIQYLVVGVPGAVLFFQKLGGRVPTPEEELEIEDMDEIVPSRFVDVSEPGVSDPSPALVPDMETEEGDNEIDVSIVIPAYNEEDRLPKTLLSILEYIKSREERFEILVVDDGSLDGTAKVVRQFEELSSSIHLLIYPKNRGKGYAVRFGMMNARGKCVLYNDADGATPIEEIERLEEAIAAGAHIAAGSRAMYSVDTAVDTVWYRKLPGRVFNGIVNMLLLPGIADTQCGFKMFVHPVARYLFSRQQAEGYAFDVEVLFLARKAGLRISEVPINWTNVPGSKVNLATDSPAMFIDLLRFRIRDLFGGYGRADYKPSPSE